MRTTESVIWIILLSILMLSSGAEADRGFEAVADSGSGRGIRGNGTGIARNDLFTYDPHGDSIIWEHDLLADTSHYAVACSSKYDGGGSWSGAGAGSFLKVGTTYYIALRQRGGAVGVRGKEWQIWSSTNLASWDTVWTLVRDSVRNAPFAGFESIEGVSLRKWGSSFYFYFSAVDATTWQIYEVHSPTISGLKRELKDGANWSPIATNKDKDPQVYECDGDYYMLANHAYEARMQPLLLRSTTAGFSSYDTVAYVAGPYVSEHNPYRLQRGMLFYDENANMFLYWGSACHVGETYLDLYWFWTGSYNLTDWSVIDRKLVWDEYTGQQATARYFDYHSVDDDRVVIIMEWDSDEDSRGHLFIWDYTDDPEGDSSVYYLDECGDCNGDGWVTCADAICLISYIYRGYPAPLDSGDVNLDGRITSADAIYLISYIYRGGPPPCEPPVAVSYGEDLAQ
jgi:hypothetical protein